jgi:hypothetical protein
MMIQNFSNRSQVVGGHRVDGVARQSRSVRRYET